MQYTKTFCFINDLMDLKTTLLLLDENHKILHYKVLYKNNNTKLDNIYCGIIEKVDYTIDSLFVRIDTDLVGFLPFRQLNPIYYDKKTKKLKKKIKKGTKILVQVIRDCMESKSLKLSNNVVFSSIFCVYMPFVEGENGISGNIKAEQRLMMKEFLKNTKTDGSLIIRTSAAGTCIEEIKKDFFSLKEFFNFVMKQYKETDSFKLLFKNDDLIQVLRSSSLSLVDAVLVRNQKTYDLLVAYEKKKLIKFSSIKIQNDREFLKKIENQLDLLYKTELFLPSNGSIIIEKTQAMVTIDVNSKRCVKGKNMEDTSFQINLEAVDIIVDQIILRNLGGIISIDLIDMKNEDHLKTVYEKFKQVFKRDKASIKILPINQLCVLQLSRERKGLSILDCDYDKCKHCENGLALSKSFLTLDFLQKLSKYNHFCFLEIHIELDVFNAVFTTHHEFINKYKNLKWKIWEQNGFSIYE